MESGLCVRVFWRIRSASCRLALFAVRDGKINFGFDPIRADLDAFFEASGRLAELFRLQTDSAEAEPGAGHVVIPLQQRFVHRGRFLCLAALIERDGRVIPDVVPLGSDFERLFERHGCLSGVASLLMQEAEVHVGGASFGANLQGCLIAFGGALMVSETVARHAEIQPVIVVGGMQFHQPLVEMRGGGELFGREAGGSRGLAARSRN